MPRNQIKLSVFGAFGIENGFKEFSEAEMHPFLEA